jgi:signal transduction histidine kinase
LFLGCPEAKLRHPLLNHFSALHSWIGGYLLYDEALSALYDIVIQTGCIWGMDHVAFSSSNGTVGSIIVAPLECSSGVLGLLLFIDASPTAFLHGECLLIEQSLPTITRQTEQVLHDACFASAADKIALTLREQNEFISLVSHELRAPLTVIKGYAGLLHAYGISDEQEDSSSAQEMTLARQQQYLATIMEYSDHLEVLISDLLDMSRIQAGHFVLRHTWVNIAQLCQRVVQMMQDRVQRQQPGCYSFRCCITSQLPLAWADPDRVQQVLTNLLENAVKYSPTGGLIEIQVRACSKIPSIISVSVRDQGIGIPLQKQPALFQPFTRLVPSQTGGFVPEYPVHSVGLGLYISRKLIEAMHGQIMLHSKEGRGTSVTFTLPARYGEEASSSSVYTENVPE